MSEPAPLDEAGLYDRLVTAIIEKHLRPGEHINEYQLSASCKLSRPRVRLVLKRLQSEGVLEFKPNRGAFISRPSVKEAQDVFDARIMMESALFRRACQVATPADIEQLKRYVQQEQEAYSQGKADFNRVAGCFHVTVAKIVGNQFMLDTMSRLMHRMCLVQSLYERERTVLCLVDEHEKLVDLIQKGDEDRCIECLVEHCNHIRDSLVLTAEQCDWSNIYEFP